jgi:hypothetical protein
MLSKPDKANTATKFKKQEENKNQPGGKGENKLLHNYPPDNNEISPEELDPDFIPDEDDIYDDASYEAPPSPGEGP